MKKLILPFISLVVGFCLAKLIPTSYDVVAPARFEITFHGGSRNVYYAPATDRELAYADSLFQYDLNIDALRVICKGDTLLSYVAY